MSTWRYLDSWSFRVFLIFHENVDQSDLDTICSLLSLLSLLPPIRPRSSFRWATILLSRILILPLHGCGCERKVFPVPGPLMSAPSCHWIPTKIWSDNDSNQNESEVVALHTSSHSFQSCLSLNININIQSLCTLLDSPSGKLQGSKPIYTHLPQVFSLLSYNIYYLHYLAAIVIILCDQTARSRASSSLCLVVLKSSLWGMGAHEQGEC